MGSNQPQMQMNGPVMKGIFVVLVSFSGIEEKDSKMPNQEDLEKEVEAVRKEEKKLGATKRIKDLRNIFERYKVTPEELHVVKKSPKVNTAKTKEQEEIKNKGREIGD